MATAYRDTTNDQLRVAIAQIAPVWLDRISTLEKVASYVSDAAEAGAALVAFGEALVPGYPFWIERTDGARFNSPRQKKLFAHYLEQGVVLERGDLDAICALCRQKKIAVYLGIVERAPDRGGHSLYCSLVYIGREGTFQSIHRKTQPTYEERLAWAAGDGHGLVVHSIGSFRVGGLNCYENWMPLVRSALYAQGEDLHVATWPGGFHNTKDVTRFVALEARSYVLSASALLRWEDIPAATPHYDTISGEGPTRFADGGSAIAAPTGEWVLAPVVDEEGLFTADLDHELVRQERHNFDLAGHYSRPDVTRLVVDRSRQATATFGEKHTRAQPRSAGCSD